MTDSWTRRGMLQATASVGASAVFQSPGLRATAASVDSTPLDVGGRLELAIDPRWIASMDGLRLQQQRPVPREIASSIPGGVPGNRCSATCPC